MATIIIQLSPELLSNPDLDFRYCLPDLLVEKVLGDLSDDGYDYRDVESPTPALQIYLQTANAAGTVPQIIETLKTERILGNDLSAVPIAIQDGDQFLVIHPPNFAGKFPRPR